MENLNTQDNDALWRVLANPADVNYAYSVDVQSLVNEYPQVGIFRALLAANGSPSGIKQAVAYFNPATLNKIINHPAQLRTIQPDQIALVDKPLSGQPFIFNGFGSFEDQQAQLITETHYLPAETEETHQPEAAAAITEQPVPQHEDAGYNPFAGIAHIDQNINADEPETVANEPATAEEMPSAETVMPIETETLIVHETAPPEHAATEQYFEPAIAEPAPVTEDENFVWPPVIDEDEEPVVAVSQPASQPEPQPEPAFSDKTEYFHQDIDDEIYDEIVSIEDISLEQLAFYQQQTTEPANTEAPPATATPDHFVFEPAEIAAPPIVGDEETFTAATVPVVDESVNEEHFYEVNDNHDVSKYHDDKLPYTFMWWLDKTRREHAAIYQPYVYNTANKPIVAMAQGEVPQRSKASELQHQYVENIFNLNAIEELERKHPEKIGERHNEKKEDQIINRFIQAEPHIKPPGNIRLDNENKAKKSSEDADEFVTETLARIYTEQMLYQKAIATYKKLMLKFPEKSLYFAGQIEQLEKKPN